jgi:two-component sensor histidine kinase
MPSLTSHNKAVKNNKRVNDILEVIMAYARLDFTQKIKVKSNADGLDAIGTGVNMLGEELEASTISLKEKELLLKEIHHRVKNNLQIVSSLLNLQSGLSTDPDFLNMISASRNRINSMALVHEMLYSSNDLKKVSIGEYIQRLSKNILNSLLQSDSNVQFSFHVKNDYFMDIDRMIPLGLILNEIITNSLKYAFKKNSGEINVEMCKTKEGHVLTVKDNGIGFPENFDPAKNSNLGLQLINILTEQIGAKLSVGHENGTSYKITLN